MPLYQALVRTFFAGVPVDAGGIVSATSNPNAAQFALFSPSAPSQALLPPKRNRLTKTLGSGISANSGLIAATQTFLLIVPIEAPCVAARIGILHPYNYTQQVLSASIYPSSNYHNSAQLNLQANSNVVVNPQGGAAGTRLYWDAAFASGTGAAGSDQPGINLAGTHRSFTFPATASNSGNVPLGAPIWWSDFGQVTSIPRDDGGVQHLLFVYVTFAAGGMSYRTVQWGQFNGKPAYRGRDHHSFWAHNNGVDYADNPTAAAWGCVGGYTGTDGVSYGLDWTPLYAVQYVTPTAGIQVAAMGDSIPAAPTTDGFSSAIQRSCWDLSTPANPIEYASLAWGGTTQSVYLPLSTLNMNAIQPSLFGIQGVSRNDLTSSFEPVLAQNLATLAPYVGSLGMRLFSHMLGAEPSFDGNAPVDAAYVEMYFRLQALAAAGSLPLLDGLQAIANQNGAPWDYLPGFSDDNTHPNAVGSEASVPAVKAALLGLLT